MIIERAFFARGIPSSALTSMEIWEVAGQLGANEPDEAATMSVEEQAWDEYASLAEGFDRTLLE